MSVAYDRGELDSYAEDAVRRIADAPDLAAVDRVGTEVLGKRSLLALAHRSLGTLDPEDRKSAGKHLNDIRAQLEAALESRRAVLGEADQRRRLVAERLDLTEVLPGRRRGHLHLVSRTQAELEDTFVGMGFEVAEGPEAESDWYNFEALNIPPDHPARGMWDTFYLELGDPGAVLLRTHTSPVQVRLLESRQLPIYAVMPGKCYRRDTADARHLPVFHQIEGLVVDRGTSFADLAGTIETFTNAYFGSAIHARLRPAYFPFTEPSAEFEITCTICRGSGCHTCSGSGWIELGGCGMVDPAVFDALHIDPEEWTGFAFGFGIDRLVQMRYGLADLRVLTENDIRFLTQV